MYVYISILHIIHVLFMYIFIHLIMRFYFLIDYVLCHTVNLKLCAV